MTKKRQRKHPRRQARDVPGFARANVRERPRESDLERYREALGDFQAGRLDEAQKRLDELIEREPAVSQPYNLAGVIALNAGRLGEAKRSFRAAIRFSHPGAEAAVSWVGLGRAEFLAGNLNQALACFNRADRLHPDFPPAKAGQAAALCDIGDYAGAEACARSALALGDDPRTQLVLARCLLFQSRMDESEELLRGLAARTETSFLARIHLAGIAYARGRTEEAESSFRALLQEQPMHPCYTELAKTKIFRVRTTRI